MTWVTLARASGILIPVGLTILFSGFNGQELIYAVYSDLLSVLT